MTRELAERAMQAARDAGATDVAISIEECHFTQVKIANSKIVAMKSWRSEGAKVFVASGQRLMESWDDDPGTLPGRIAELVAILAGVKENPGFAGLPEVSARNSPTAVDARVVNAARDLPELFWQALTAAEEEGAERCSGVAQMEHSRRTLVTSTGFSESDETAWLNLSIRAFKGEGSGHGVACTTNLNELEGADAGRHAGRLASLAAAPAAQTEPGRYSLVLDAMVWADLMETMGRASSAFAIESGMSYLHDDLGTVVAAPVVNLREDGGRADGIHSRRFDAEGMPTRCNSLIEEGVLKGRLHNSSSAKRHAAEPTGNAGILMPHPHTMVMLGGEGGDTADLIRECQDGLYLTNTWYTRFANFRTGDFSTIPRDACLLIKDGELKSPVRGLRISDNICNVLKSVRLVAKRPRQIYWWGISTPAITPDVLIDDVQISVSRE